MGIGRQSQPACASPFWAPAWFASRCSTLRNQRRASCRCASGQLHSCWVLTRSENGRDRLYSVPRDQRARVRKEAAEYRLYQRARALVVKRNGQLLALADELAAHRLRVWPRKKEDPPPG